MVENAIKIDLNEFKLHLHLKKLQLTLLFDSPSRRFYFSIIALIVNEMKRLGRITSIPLEEHLGLLVMLNETIGGSAGSSNKENLLPRIYKKWKDALPDLEDAPLFKVLGRKKNYYEGAGRTYPFTETERDNWANLFGYKGSAENVRLKFAIDQAGVTLEDTVIVYEEALDGEAWERFLSNLKVKERKSSPELEAVPIQRASLEKMAFPLPDKPSIAVLPFTNMSGKKELGYFCDGLAEGIIDALSKSEHIFVIARNSSFVYKGRAVKIRKVAEEIGVRYVIEGSVQQEKNRVRITAQLADALSGSHLFSERYDRDLKEVLNLQDEIVMKIMSAVRVKLTSGEAARLSGKGTKDLNAYLKVLQASEIKAIIQNRENLERSMRLCEEAIALDPEYSFAYSMLSTAFTALVAIGASDSPREILQKAIEIGEKAIILDETNASAHVSLVFPYIYLREFDKAISEGEKAISLSPNSAAAYWALGSALIYSGRAQEGILMLQKSLRLSPIPVHSQVLGDLADAYLRLGQYEDTIATYRKVLQIYGPDHLRAHIGLATTYTRIGRENEARAEGAEVLRIDPKFSWEQWIKGLPFSQARKDRLADSLRKIGLM
jgi:adenylate cyclase